MLQLVDRILLEIGLEKEIVDEKRQVFQPKCIEEVKKLIIAAALS